MGLEQLNKAIEDLDRKVKSVKTEAKLTTAPHLLEDVIRSATTTLNVGVAISSQERTKRLIRYILWRRSREYVRDMVERIRMVL